MFIYYIWVSSLDFLPIGQIGRKIPVPISGNSMRLRHTRRCQTISTIGHWNSQPFPTPLPHLEPRNLKNPPPPSSGTNQSADRRESDNTNPVASIRRPLVDLRCWNERIPRRDDHGGQARKMTRWKANITEWGRKEGSKEGMKLNKRAKRVVGYFDRSVDWLLPQVGRGDI